MPPQDTNADPVQGILDPLTGVDKTVKALAWDAYQSGDQQTFKTKLDALNLPQTAKAALWDAKYGQGGGPPSMRPQRPRDPNWNAPGFEEKHPILATAKDAATAGMYGFGESLYGFGQGVMDTVHTFSGPLRKGLGMAPVEQTTPIDSFDQPAQAIGKGTERIAEFLVPEAIAGKWAKIYNAAQRLRKAGMGVQAARLLGSIPEAVMQAIGAYGTAKMQGAESPGVAATVAGGLPVAGAAAANLAPKIMKSALGQVSAETLKKFKTTTQDIANTLMENGANVTKKGLEKLQIALDISDDQLDKVITSLKGVIDPAKVAARTKEVAAKFGEQVNPAEDLDTIHKKTAEFMSHPVRAQQVITGVTQQPTGLLDARGNPITKAVPVYTKQTAPLSAAEAQSMKRGTYQQLKGKYTKLGSAGTETEKALARGLREEIENLAHSQGVHDVEAINQNEAKLMAALEATGARLAKMEKPIDAGAWQYAVRWAARHPISALAAVAKADGAPIRSIVARALASDSPKLRVATGMVRAAVTSMAAGPGPQEGDTADVSSVRRPRASRGTSTRPPIEVTSGLPATR